MHVECTCGKNPHERGCPFWLACDGVPVAGPHDDLLLAQAQEQRDDFADKLRKTLERIRELRADLEKTKLAASDSLQRAERDTLWRRQVCETWERAVAQVPLPHKSPMQIISDYPALRERVRELVHDRAQARQDIKERDTCLRETVTRADLAEAALRRIASGPCRCEQHTAVSGPCETCTARRAVAGKEGMDDEDRMLVNDSMADLDSGIDNKS